MADQEKIRLGSGKKKSETWFKTSLCIDDAIQHSFEYNGKRYVKVDINVYAEPNQYGKDVQVTLDTYKPDQTKSAKQPVQATVVEAEIVSDDLPF
jgi:hypothetical protein